MIYEILFRLSLCSACCGVILVGGYSHSNGDAMNTTLDERYKSGKAILYKGLMKYHPDRNGNTVKNQRMTRILNKW